MKHHFKLPCVALLVYVFGCSGADEAPGPIGAAGSGVSGSTAGGTAAGGGAGGTAGAGAGAGGVGVMGGSTATGGQSGSAALGGNAGVGQSGSGGSGGVGTDGQSLYTAKCAACHGMQGVGGPLAPELQHPVRDYSAWVVRHGRAMTTFPAPMLAVTTADLSDSALDSIWDYLDEPPQPTTGQGLFLDYCANCHGADGKGGPTMRNILGELDELKSRVRAGSHQGEFDMRREYMPKLGVDRISDAELDLIYAYVESL